MTNSPDRKSQPELIEIGAVDIQEAKPYRLDNGVPVYYINSGFQDLVKVELLFLNRTFDPSNALLHSATNRMLGEGTSKHNAQQLED